METKFVNGKSKVRVIKRSINEQTGKENIVELHRGIVVKQSTTHLKVFNNAPIQEGGDTSQAACEWFAVSSPNIWVEPAGELNNEIAISPEIR